MATSSRSPAIAPVTAAPATLPALPEPLRQRGVFDLLTATRQGHRRPDLGCLEATTMLHTAQCSYWLDDEGVCREVVPREGAGALPGGAERCKGAQYVASLDMRTSEGLAGEPRVGACALFVGRGVGLRMALIRTASITGIESRNRELSPVNGPAAPSFRSTQHGWATIDATPRKSTGRVRIPRVPIPWHLMQLLSQ